MSRGQEYREQRRRTAKAIYNALLPLRNGYYPLIADIENALDAIVELITIVRGPAEEDL